MTSSFPVDVAVLYFIPLQTPLRAVADKMQLGLKLSVIGLKRTVMLS